MSEYFAHYKANTTTTTEENHCIGFNTEEEVQSMY